MHAWKQILLLVLAGLILVVGALAVTNPVYEKTQVTSPELAGTDEWHGCIHYYAKCRCAGFLSIAESHPPKHFCAGIELCSEINKTLCGGA